MALQSVATAQVTVTYRPTRVALGDEQSSHRNLLVAQPAGRLVEAPRRPDRMAATDVSCVLRDRTSCRPAQETGSSTAVASLSSRGRLGSSAPPRPGCC